MAGAVVCLSGDRQDPSDRWGASAEERPERDCRYVVEMDSYHDNHDIQTGSNNNGLRVGDNGH